ncbi:Na+/H+ antiporter NhaC family protein [Candidatus Atribacteria bacterium 1244-E10-H5-B2]|nr:MAG: Na+/H+ antiporter NhaC family protein [Candidatus Atribacteria bacterium 1244-E10-H5-B2]
MKCKSKKYSIFLLFFVLILILLTTFGIASAAEEGETAKYYGAWSLVPSLLAVGLCLVLKEALLSLVTAVIVGGTILANGNIITGITKTVSTMIAQIADPWEASILLFFFVVGGLMGIIFYSGGAAAFVDFFRRRAKNARSIQLFGWIGGLVIFIDDYANAAFVGSLFRPLSDRYHISREKLSYIVDSTASPVSCIFLISTWIGFQVGLIGKALPADWPVKPYTIFLQSIPFNFYCLFAIAFVFMIAWTGRDFGPMLKAEYRARTTNHLWGENSTPLSGESEYEVVKNVKPRMINMIVPLVLMVGLSFFFMYKTGGGGAEKSFMEALADADSMLSIVYGTFIALFVSMIMYWIQHIDTPANMMKPFLIGAKGMLYAAMIQVSAWSIGAICNDLGTAEYIVDAVKGIMSPLLLPLIVFFISAFIAFCTGTSWGTMAITTPIAIPLAIAINANLPLVVAAILAGSTMGDHCGPISDTTVMSSTFSGSDHIDHVKTQIPYALTCSAVAAICYITAGAGLPAIVNLIIGMGILYGALIVLSNISAKSQGITFPLPEWDLNKKEN